MVRGGEVLAPRVERCARRPTPPTDHVQMTSCLVVVESPADIAPGGPAAAAIAFLASRPSCESIAVWAPAMPSPGSLPANAIDEVLTAAAANGVQVSFSAVDMRDGVQVARACRTLWGAATSAERAVDAVVCVQESARDASGAGTALGLTEDELAHTYAQPVGLMNALDVLTPAALFTVSPFFALDDSMASPLRLASRALHDAVATVISQRHGTRVASVNIALPAAEGVLAPAAAEVTTALAALATMSGDEGVYALQTIIRLSAGVSISISTAAASLGLVSAAAEAAAEAAAAAASLRIHAPPPVLQQSLGPTLDDIQRRVCAAAATVLAQGPESPPLEPSTSLWDLGMNSVLAVSLASALEAEFGRSLPASIAFDYGTLKDLAGFIYSKYFAAEAAAAAAVAAAAAQAAQLPRLPSVPTVAEIQRRVCDAAAPVLAQGDGAPLEASTSLWDLGMNSVLAVSLAAALEAEFARSLPASIAFDYGTLKDLAGFIHSKYFAVTAAAAAAAAQTQGRRHTAQAPAQAPLVKAPSGPTVAEIQRRVCDAAASVLVQGDATPLEPSTSLWDLGMNSVLAVSLASALESEFGCSLPASIAFDYGTLKDLAGFIHSKYFASAAADAAAAVSAASTVVRRISTPNRRRHSRKVSRVPSIVYLEAPEPEPPTAREVVFSVLAQLLPQEFQPSRARTISLATSSNAF